MNYFLVNVDFVRNIALNSLLVITQKFKESIDKGNAFGTLLTNLLTTYSTNLLKAFDCIGHLVMIVKLFAF